MKGLKVSLESSYAPDTGAKNGLLKAELKTNPATLTIDTVCALTAQGTLCTFLSDNNLRTWILAALWWTPLLSSVTLGGWRVCRCIRVAKTWPWSWQSRWPTFSSMNIFYQAAYDTSKGKLVKNNFALGYATSDFVLHSNVNDGSIFGASIYQKVENTGSGQAEVYESTMCNCAFLKVKSGLETGVNLGYTASR